MAGSSVLRDLHMTGDRFRVTLWGVSGSLPVGSGIRPEFGGNTTCIEMRCGPHVLLFDAGSGIATAGGALAAEGVKDITLLFTHWHYDHVIGLPFFAPFFDPRVAVTAMSGHATDGTTTAAMMTDFMRAPFFPVGPGCYRARLATADFTGGAVLTPHPGLRLRTARLNHPGGCTGYRVEWAGRSVALVTDTEHAPGRPDEGILELIEGADLMLYDAHYEDAEFDRFRGFGHSTWQEAIRLAQAAGVPRVGMVHHAVARTDAALHRIEAEAKHLWPGAFCGRDGTVIDL